MRSIQELGVLVDVDFVNGRSSSWAYVWGALRMLALNVRSDHYDLLHAHAGHCAVLARLQWRSPVLVSYVGYDVYGKPKADGRITLKSRIEAAIFRQLARVVDGTITKSARMEALLPPAARLRNTVLPNGVDRRVFRPMPRAEARRRLGWTPDEVAVLFAGRSDWTRKRVALARAACELARHEIDNLTFRVCEGLQHDVVPLWMNAADVLLLPSLAEGSPNVVKEALACNLPVVATDVGDVPQLLEGVDHCRVVPVDAFVEEFAGALISVLRDAPVRSNGRARTTHLDAAVIAERLVGIYVAVATRGTKPPRRPRWKM